MRKFFCSTSVVLFLCVLSVGYYGTYKISDMRQIQAQEKEEEAKSVSSGTGGYGLYYLKDGNGYVMVYEGDKTTLYEPTSILVETLPKTLQEEIRGGKFLKTQEELYSFLENYSS